MATGRKKRRPTDTGHPSPTEPQEQLAMTGTGNLHPQRHRNSRLVQETLHPQRHRNSRLVQETLHPQRHRIS